MYSLEKIELLFLTYARKLPKRISLLDFQEIVVKHTSYRQLEKKLRRRKLLELIASFNIHGMFIVYLYLFCFYLILLPK